MTGEPKAIEELEEKIDGLKKFIETAGEEERIRMKGDSLNFPIVEGYLYQKLFSGFTLTLMFLLWAFVLGCSAPELKHSFFVSQVPEPPSEKLIVFIHGVLGDATDTWKNENSGNYWPAMIAEDPDFQNQKFDVYSVAYPSPALSFSSNITEIANRLLYQLKDGGMFEKYTQIHFIAHSMGGLITKRMLVALYRPDEIKNLMKIRSVLFFSTPSQGAALGGITNWFSSNPQFGNMETADANAYIQTLEDDWQGLLRGRKELGLEYPMSFCAYETLPTIFPFVVSRVSAVTQCDSNRYAIDANHMNIVKPFNQESETYQWSKARIFQAANKPGPSGQIVVLMDSGEEELIYNDIRKEIGGTNADDIADILGGLEIITVKELTHLLWQRESQVKALSPSLIILHLSCFWENTVSASQSDKKFQTFIDSMLDSDTKFLVYTRGLKGEEKAITKERWKNQSAFIKNLEDKGRLKLLIIDRSDNPLDDPVFKRDLIDEVEKQLGI